MEVKLSSFIFRRQNVRDSNGDIAFYRIWIDRWEEDREAVDTSNLILHLVANYSPEVEEKLLGKRRGLVDLPVDMLVSRSVLDVLNGTRFILNLTLPRKALTAKHVSMLGDLFDHYQEAGFLFSIHEDLLSSRRDLFTSFGKYIGYVFMKRGEVDPADKLVIWCGSDPLRDYDFLCEGDYEDVLIINSLKHMQAAVSKLISMMSDEVSIDDLAETIKGDPALVTKLLQYVNSPLFPHRREIESIKSAINYLGLENLKKFLIAVWMSQFFGQDPSFLEFVRRMLFNAFLLESFAREVGSVPRDKLFLLGLFYRMPDAFGVRPEVFFNSLQLPEEVVRLFSEKELQKYLRILKLLDSEELEEYLKDIGIEDEKFGEHVKYARDSVEAFTT